MQSDCENNASKRVVRQKCSLYKGVLWKAFFKIMSQIESRDKNILEIEASDEKQPSKLCAEKSQARKLSWKVTFKIVT